MYHKYGRFKAACLKKGPSRRLSKIVLGEPEAFCSWLGDFIQLDTVLLLSANISLMAVSLIIHTKLQLEKQTTGHMHIFRSGCNH